MTDTMQAKEAKVDKRTREYRDAEKKVDPHHLEPVGDNHVREDFRDPVMVKLDEMLEILQELRGRTPLILATDPPEVKEPGMTPVEDLTKCFECGAVHPEVPMYRTACNNCVRENL